MNILLNLELMELDGINENIQQNEPKDKNLKMTNKNKFKILDAITLTHVTNVGFQLLCLHHILLLLPFYSHKMFSAMSHKRHISCVT